MQWPAPSSAEKSSHRSTAGTAAPVDGASSLDPSCTSATKSWSRTWPDGAGNECPNFPTPRTSRSLRTGHARCSPHRHASSTCCASARSYAREGIPHLWLIDPVERTLEAFELHDGQWLLIASAQDDEPVSIRPFDAITFSLGELWD